MGREFLTMLLGKNILINLYWEVLKDKKSRLLNNINIFTLITRYSSRYETGTVPSTAILSTVILSTVISSTVISSTRAQFHQLGARRKLQKAGTFCNWWKFETCIKNGIAFWSLLRLEPSWRNWTLVVLSAALVNTYTAFGHDLAFCLLELVIQESFSILIWAPLDQS